MQSKNVITKPNQHQIFWDFSLIDNVQQNSHIIDCILIQNNIVINLPWLKKSIDKTQNIVLADGGANIFYQTQLKNFQKVKAIIGDLDSIRQQVSEFYKQKNTVIIKVEDQDRNDFEKAVEWISKNGWNIVFAFGSFGGRLDHTLATISNSEKLTRLHQNLQLVLLGKTNIMCVLRGGFKHRIRISSDISRKGCGIISFNKISHVQTTGFRWNLGKEHVYSQLEWGRFISTSNQIMGDEVTIETFDKQSDLKFVVTFVC